MGARVVLLVLCVTIVSAGPIDVNRKLVSVPSSDTVQRYNSETVLERQNIDYGIKTNLQREASVEPLYRYNSEVNNRRIPKRHSLRYHNHNHNHGVSENIDNNNSIGYTQDEYKLRTNVPSDSYAHTTEYVTSSMDAFTNSEQNVNTHTASALTQEYLARQTSVREPDVHQYRHGDKQNTDIPIMPKTNKNSGININNQPKTESNNVSQHSSDQNNLMHEKGIFVNNNTNEPANERRNNIPKTNQTGGVAKNPRTNETRPINSDRGQAGASDNIPNHGKDVEEEIPWVWGGDKNATTEMDSLDDRAAFSGDQCPTGKTKVEGICVDKH